MAKVYSTALLLFTGLAATLVAGSCVAASGGQTQESAKSAITNQVAVSASAESTNLLRQATLADPRLQQMVQEYRQQFGINARLEVGAIAAMAYYGLAEWFVLGGDQVNRGHALLIKQEGHWRIVAVHTGGAFSGSQASALLHLGVPEEIIPPLLKAFRPAGAELGNDGATGEGRALLTQSADLPYLALEDVVIGGISLDMDEAAIRQQLGAPLSVQDEESGCCGLLRQLEYPTLSIGLVEGLEPGEMMIYAIETTSPEVATRAGVRVGDSQRVIVEVYGPPHDQGTEGDRSFLTYIVEYDSSRLGFELKDGEIISISYYSLLN